MKNFIPKMNKSLTSIVFLIVFLGPLFFIQAIPTKAEDPQAEMVWVLTETRVNPYDGQLEFYGGGATPGWFGEARFEGTFVKYAVSETSFRVDDRYVDHEWEYHNVTIETYFEKPPLKLIPGETIELIAGFAHSGMAGDGGTRVQFWYDSENVDIQPNFVFAYAPWAEDFNGITEVTYKFVVPPATSSGEIEIYATWWNAEPCLVIWKFQAQEVSAPVVDVPPFDERRSRIKSEEECARMLQEVVNQEVYGPQEDYVAQGYVGLVTAISGDVVQEYCAGGERPLLRGGRIKIGDCIRTGPVGRIRITMADRDVRRNAGPTTISFSTNSVACFYKFDANFDDSPQIETVIDLIKGAVRVFFKGWGRNDSVSIRTGVTVCGIRGSEVLITYVPSDDLVYTMVLEGHMDVTSEATGETVSLTENQSLVVANGDFYNAGPATQEQWDSQLEDLELRDEDFPDVDIIEWENIDEDVPNAGNVDDENSLTQETRPPLAGYIFILCSFLICGVGFVAMLAIVYFLRKRSK
jgi:hypothetical protein